MEGAEVVLAAARIQATTETYMGLVEVGVGLIPGGGGTKELYVKTLKVAKGSMIMIYNKLRIKYLKQ